MVRFQHKIVLIINQFILINHLMPESFTKVILNKHNEISTYGIFTGNSGPRSFDPSQKQSRGVIMAQGNKFSKG